MNYYRRCFCVAICSNHCLTITGDGALESVGGNATNKSGYSGIYANNLEIDANVTAFGGDTTDPANMGGAGVFARITMAREMFIFAWGGGIGSTANGQRPSIIAKDVYITKGNVGEIAMDGRREPETYQHGD